MAHSAPSKSKQIFHLHDAARVINPATEELIGEYPWLSDEALQERLQRSEQTFRAWRREPIDTRTGLLKQVAAVLRRKKHPLAQQMTTEMGKPISQAVGEVEKCAWVCDYYAQYAADFLAPREVDSDADRSFVRFDPLGPVLGIMPWNFPLWQVFRFAAATLAAGNSVLVKHSANVAGCAISIERLFDEAGFPEGAFTNLILSKDQTERLIESPVVRGVSLTGSVRAGTAVASTAGKHVKKCVLELGGSDPFVVLADAPLEKVVAQAVQARTQNSGQSCIAAKRFIVEEAVSEKFEELFTAHMDALQVGDPLEQDTQLGPLAREDLLESIADQVERSVEAGAQLRCGGRRLDRTGYFYPATVLANVEPGMPAFDEETFGPAAAIIRAKDRAHAIQLANHSQFGLGASIWTSSQEEAMDDALQLAEQMEAGAVFINSMVQSDPRLPFGGVKKSGYGRELSEYGIHEFVNVKTVSAEREVGD